MTVKDPENGSTESAEVEEENLPLTPSRAAKKRSMDDLLKLVLFLMNLSPGDFEAMEFSDELLGALTEARKIKAHGARRRQVRYVIQILDSGDVEGVKAKISRMKELRDARVTNFHAIEAMRDRVLAGGDEALQEVAERFPNVDRQQLRNLQRAALKDKVPGTNVKANRAMFRFLQDLYAAADRAGET